MYYLVDYVHDLIVNFNLFDNLIDFTNCILIYTFYLLCHLGILRIYAIACASHGISPSFQFIGEPLIHYQILEKKGKSLLALN